MASLVSPPENDPLRVLAMPELLNMIFEFSSQATNALCARVCKQWSDVALDILWHEVTNITYLFDILAPLEHTDEGYYKFTRIVESSDWKKLQRYSGRIKSLVYTPRAAFRGTYLEQSAFDEIAWSRTSSILLPNLCTLKWDAPIKPCTLFMHENVHSLSVTLFEETPYNGPFIRDVTTKMTDITDLNLQLPFDPLFPLIQPDVEVVGLLSQSKNLKSLTLPSFCFTTKVAETLAYSPKLEALELRRSPDSATPWVYEVKFDYQLHGGAYLTLSKLTMDVAFRDATIFLSSLSAPSNLVNLRLESPIVDSFADIRHLITVIVKNCRRLRSLAMLSFIGIVEPLEEEYNDEGQYLDADTLWPLFECLDLKHFEIAHRHPLCLQLTDVQEIAMSMPNVETLDLNKHPLYAPSSDLTLRALFPFARHCHRLHTLGLFLDATPQDTFDPDFYYPVFRELRCLMTGSSVIHENDKQLVALFLSRILPVGCAIKVAWEDYMEEMGVSNSESWSYVARLLPLFIGARQEERHRMTRQLLTA